MVKCRLLFLMFYELNLGSVHQLIDATCVKDRVC